MIHDLRPHDPYCPSRIGDPCRCTLIEAVREDERVMAARRVGNAPEWGNPGSDIMLRRVAMDAAAARGQS